MDRPGKFAEGVANEIRAEMGRKRITIAALAKQMGEDEQRLRRRIGTVSNPVGLRLDDVEAIADALDVPVAMLIQLPSLAAR